MQIRNSKFYFCPTKPSCSENVVISRDTTSCTYVDVNGDGLPDRVYNNDSVSLNIGYKFLPPEPWGTQYAIRGSYKSMSIGFSGGGDITSPFNLDNFSIGGGANLGVSDNMAEARLIDIDGDGIPDKVRKEGEHIYVNFGYGNGVWSSERRLNNLSQISWGHNASDAVSVSATVGFSPGVFKVEANAHVSPMGNSFGNEKVTLMDMNGDGLVDYVTSYGQNQMKICYNKGGKAHLLKKVTNVMGGEFELDYAFVQPTVKHPQCQWVLSKLTVSDNQPNHMAPQQVCTIQYKNGYYDRFERISYGFDTVIIARLSCSSNGQYATPYSYTVQGY